MYTCIHLVERVAITTTPESDREAVVGGGTLMFSCPFTGIPTPTLSWFFNGQMISGVNIQDDSLTIAAPQVGNSGAYQCFVENSVSEEITSWVLEVREPGKIIGIDSIYLYTLFVYLMSYDYNPSLPYCLLQRLLKSFLST